MESCIPALDLISIPDKTKVIKTWLNGWATTYRIKGDFKRDCLLGCLGEPDSLAHYLMCPRIYACLLHVVPSTSDDPLTRCGVANPSKVSLLVVACAFSAYHALKAQVRCGKIKAESDIIDGPISGSPGASSPKHSVPKQGKC